MSDYFDEFLKKLSDDNPALKAIIKDTDAFKRLMEGDDKSSMKALNDLLILLNTYEEKKKFGGHLQGWFEEGTPYGIDKLPKHRAFFDAGTQYRIRAFIASNRSGKSQAAAFEAASHATGLYVPWWAGKRFNRPVKIWACGISWGQVKEVLQSKLYGVQGNPGTGMIASNLIVNKATASGIPGALESMTVRHVNGGNSIISFKTYEQGIKAFQGAEVDFIIMDEEPPYDIFDECDTRLMTTGGVMILTFTPQNGLTPTIVNLYQNADLLAGAEPLPDQVMLLAKKKEHGDEAQASRDAYQKKTIGIVQVSMYDAPWLTREQIEDRKQKSPPHLRDARIYGRVSVGEGTIYPVALDKITCAPFQIPKHWKRTFGMDVGWQVTAAVWGALNPDDDVLYIYSEYVGQEKEPVIHASAMKQRGDWIIGNIDYQAQTRNAQTGQRLIDIYRSHGLRLVNADKAVDAGIVSVLERMTTGRLKIFNNCHGLLSEIPIYRRDSNGKIIKELDHSLDALRYLVMGLQNAKLPPTNTNKHQSAYKEYTF
jgi:phage terminase large subunit-like protein